MAYDLLVVDDSKAALFLFKKIIGLTGVPINKLLTAENGIKALEVLKENKVDFIMTDINMPEMDGFEFLKHLKEDDKFKDIPVVVITTEGRGKYVDRAMELGAMNYLKKPFKPEQVKSLILEALGEDDYGNVDESENGDF